MSRYAYQPVFVLPRLKTNGAKIGVLFRNVKPNFPRLRSGCAMRTLLSVTIPERAFEKFEHLNQKHFKF
jgi:hypothetical protein